MSTHVFVDETKQREYTLAAIAVPTDALAQARRRMRGLLLGNQRRIHFKDEAVGRKRQILDAIRGLPLEARVYVCESGAPELRARQLCLERLVRDLAATGADRLVIETDESMLVHDRRVLFNAKAMRADAPFQYAHMRAHEEPLLWVADAVAWCWPHVTPWRPLIQPLVVDVMHVS